MYNGGIENSGPFEARFYSGDPDGCCGQQIGDPVTVSSIPGQGHAPAQVQWDTTLFEGDEEIFVKVDIPDDVSEYDENNNKTSAGCFIYPNTADLYVGSVTFSNYAPQPGDLIDISARIDNRGGSGSNPDHVDFYVGDPDGTGSPIGATIDVPAIAAFGNSWITLQDWEVPAIGAYYIYARLDSNGRKNFGVLNAYPEPQPDLGLTSNDITIMPDQLVLGSPIEFAATVHNTAAEALKPSISFIIGGISSPIDIVKVPSIAASAYIQCKSWTTMEEGIYVVGVHVLPAFPQHDVTYGNNFATKSFCVSSGDADGDGDLGICDNCPTVANPNQEDSYPPQRNNCGDACECEGNFDGDPDQDGTDAATFKAHFGRSVFHRRCNNADPCNGDFSCDGDVDGTDAALFKSDFGRSTFLRPCPNCVTVPWCVYP